MNALDILKRDHRKVEDIISSLNATWRNDTHSRHTLVQQLKEELKMHEHLEAEVFYPALMAHKEAQHLAKQAYLAHIQIDKILSILQDTDSHRDEWKTRLAELQAHLFNHIQHEEEALFSIAKTMFTLEQLEEMGMEMAAMKDYVPA